MVETATFLQVRFERKWNKIILEKLWGSLSLHLGGVLIGSCVIFVLSLLVTGLFFLWRWVSFKMFLPSCSLSVKLLSLTLFYHVHGSRKH